MKLHLIDLICNSLGLYFSAVSGLVKTNEKGT